MKRKFKSIKRIMAIAIAVTMLMSLITVIPAMAADGIKVYTASDMSRSGGASVSSSTSTFQWNSNATAETKALFGDPVSSTYYSKMINMSNSAYSISKAITVSSSEAGNYKLYILGKEYNDRYYRIQVDGGTIIDPDKTSGVKVGDLTNTSDNRALAVTTYAIGNLSEGSHTIKVLPNASGNSMAFFAMGFVPTDYKTFYSITANQFTGGSSGTTDTSYLPYSFTNNADESVKSITKDSSNQTQVASGYTSSYRNYIGSGTSTSYTGLNLKAGTYDVYYLGGWNDQNIEYTIGDVSFSYSKGNSKNFAVSATAADRSQINLYKTTFTLSSDLTNGTISINNSSTYLPDLYSVVIAKQPTWSVPTEVSTSYESGYYMNGETKEGIIRFFQGFDGDTVSEYGFYFINATDGSVYTTKLSNASALSETSGFYGDMIGIPDTETGNIIAKAYVVINDVVYWNDNSITATVDWNTLRPSPSV